MTTRQSHNYAKALASHTPAARCRALDVASADRAGAEMPSVLVKRHDRIREGGRWVGHVGGCSGERAGRSR
jgi:hypothetical protein